MDLVATERHEKRLRLILNRPDKANALSREMLHGLKAVFEDASVDESLHVLTIEGAGGRVFCAGADLDELSGDPNDPADDIWEEMSAALAAIPFLTIALVNGPCIGGATTLAVGCDIRLAVPEATFGYPVLRNGVFPTRRDSGRLSRLIGPGRSALFLLGGVRIDAQEARDWGLVERIVARDDLEAAAFEISAAAREADRAHLAELKARCKETES